MVTVERLPDNPAFLARIDHLDDGLSGPEAPPAIVPSGAIEHYVVPDPRSASTDQRPHGARPAMRVAMRSLGFALLTGVASAAGLMFQTLIGWIAGGRMTP